MDVGLIVVLLSIAGFLIYCWFKRRSILEKHPDIRELCWGIHRILPCLGLYPSDATDPHSMFQAQQVNVQANPITTSNALSEADSTYHPPTTDNTYPPPPPAADVSYLPPVTGTEVPIPPYSHLPQPDVPPPSYTEVTTNTARTSGGWFSKLAKP